ncbi:uncharacterized protein isoform X1 [Takifugu rubripes]|uniref:uncharacterized protein isoform X1 n=1 Tax=Takifugu rubripes TaxID=31033 RepID=UPI001145EC50|nr:uncharacterized protein LOC115250410 isoform X1 [Takifugu rubripes]
MLENQDQENLSTLLQHNRLLRRTYRQMNDELQALDHILQQKQQRSVPTDNSWVSSLLPTFWLVQEEVHLFTPEELQYLQRSNNLLHQLNRTLAQFQMTMFKKLVDITKPEKRPEKQTQTKAEWQTMKRELELQQEKEELQNELDRLNFEMCVAKRTELITQSRYNSLRAWVRLTKCHNNRMRRLLEKVMENQVLLLQVRILEEEFQHRRSVLLRVNVELCSLTFFLPSTQRNLRI